MPSSSSAIVPIIGVIVLFASSSYQMASASRSSSSSPSPSNAVLPRVRGPPAVTIPVHHGRMGPQGLLQTNSTPLSLWCHAVDSRLLSVHDSRGEPVLATEEIAFIHNGVRRTANLSRDNNGTLELDQVYAHYAGNWTCIVRTKGHGVVNGEINVHLPPVVLSNTSLRIDEKSEFQFEASGVSVVRGDEARLDCPVFGHPKPKILWRKGDRNVVLSDRVKVQSDGTLVIGNITDADGGAYSCNAFSGNGAKRVGDKARKWAAQHNVTIERKLRVKSELAWLFPLGIIIVTAVVLFIIIVLCEIRKRHTEKKHLLESGAGGDND